MIIGILKEPAFESRVSLLAEGVAAFTKKGLTVWVEQDAGSKAFCTNEDYQNAGAVVQSADKILSEADVLLSINHDSIPASLKNKVLIGVYQPLFNHKLMSEWAKSNLTSFSLDMLPRTTRAQSMDVLSSQANIAGYKAVLLAASMCPHYFPMFMTAAGSVPPAKVLVLGAGVAGLQAIATARRLGAVVQVFDTRPAVKEEVMSLGGKFIEVEGAADASKSGGYAVEQTEEFQQRQKAKIAEWIAKSDVVISTAQIPGKKAPILVTRDMIENMRKGSIIIDLAAATGGNTDLTQNNTTVEHQGVKIVGNSALASEMSYDSSKLYGKNIWNFLQLIVGPEGNLNLNFEDDLVAGACMTHNGQIVNERVKSLEEA